MDSSSQWPYNDQSDRVGTTKRLSNARLLTSKHGTQTFQCAIPVGCTSVLQRLDVSVNKSFKSVIRGKWVQYMREQAQSQRWYHPRISPNEMK